MSASTRKRGRPATHSANEQWQRITAATEQLFSQHELDAHSMAEIARLAGMSKRTLYALVPSKEALISHVIRSKRLPVEDLLDIPVASTEESLKLLERFLLGWMQAAFSTTTINILRMVMDERKTFPGIARSYFAHGAEFLHTLLTRWLREQAKQGYLRLDQPALVADVLTSVLVPRSQLDCAMGDTPAPSTPQMRRRVKAIMAFCQLSAPLQTSSAGASGIARKKLTRM